MLKYYCNSNYTKWNSSLIYIINCTILADRWGNKLYSWNIFWNQVSRVLIVAYQLYLKGGGWTDIQSNQVLVIPLVIYNLFRVCVLLDSAFQIFVHGDLFFTFAYDRAEGNLKDNAFYGIPNFLSLTVKFDLCGQFV